MGSSQGQNHDASEVDGYSNPRQFLNLSERRDDGRLDICDLLMVRIEPLVRGGKDMVGSQWLCQESRTERSR
jgi:hypothetical protein